MMNMEPAPQHDSYVWGRGRGSGVPRGDPRGGLRGRGGGRAGGNPGGGRSSGCELGKLPTDLRLLMHGQLQVCKKYNTMSGCTNPMDAKSGNCTMELLQGFVVVTRTMELIALTRNRIPD